MRSGVDVGERSVKSREPPGGFQELQIEVPKELLPSELREYLGLREFLLFLSAPESKMSLSSNPFGSIENCRQKPLWSRGLYLG